MVDPGHVFRRAFSWLPTQFASQSDAPVGPRQFGSTEHLSTEAVAAFVDGELRMTAHLRAAHHLSLCPQCARRSGCPAAGPRRVARFLPDRHSHVTARPACPRFRRTPRRLNPTTHDQAAVC